MSEDKTALEAKKYIFGIYKPIKPRSAAIENQNKSFRVEFAESNR
jgi:hypothetical protein